MLFFRGCGCPLQSDVLSESPQRNIRADTILTHYVKLLITGWLSSSCVEIIDAISSDGFLVHSFFISLLLLAPVLFYSSTLMMRMRNYSCQCLHVYIMYESGFPTAFVSK